MQNFESQNSNPYRTPTSPKFQKSSTKIQSLIFGHRTMMIAMLIHFFGIGLFVIGAINDDTPVDAPAKSLPAVAVAGFVMLFIAGIAASFAAWKLGCGVLSPTAKYLYVALAWIPIPLLTVLLMWQCISKANFVLENAGIEVGLFGPKT